LLSLWGKRQRLVAPVQWHGKQAGKERHRFLEIQVHLGQHLFQAGQFLRGRLVPTEIQPPLQIIDQGMKAAVFAMGCAMPMKDSWLVTGYMLLEQAFPDLMQQSRLADARLADKEAHLSQAFLGLFPAIKKQLDLTISADKRCQRAPLAKLQAMLKLGFVKHPEKLHRSGDALDGARAERLTI